MVRAFLLVCRCLSSLCIFKWQSRERGSKISHVSSYKGTNPIPESSAFMTQLPPKGPSSKFHQIHMTAFITWTSTYEFWGSTSIQCIAQNKSKCKNRRIYREGILSFYVGQVWGICVGGERSWNDAKEMIESHAEKQE